LTWWVLVILIVGGIALSSLSLSWFIRYLGRREPYSTFLRLRTRRKLAFFRLLLRDKSKRVPLYVKLIPIALVIYLSIPFDIVPDFVPVLGYLDDVAIAMLALVLIIKLTPRSVVLEMLQQAQRESASSTAGEGRSTEKTEG
jgi:uncharacterized membrane protein YkvA (DUF1232 family)